MKSYFYQLTVSLFVTVALFGNGLAQAQEVEIVPFKDNTLYENSTGATSNGAGSHMFVGLTNQGSIRRALLAFDVAANVPAGAVVQSVVLRVSVTKTIVPATNATLHPVLTDWGEGTSDASANEGGGGGSTTNDATWIHTFFDTQTWTNPGGDFDSQSVSSASLGSAGGTADFPSTNEFVALVQSWLDSPDGNFGLLILGDESTSPSAKRIGSREGAEGSRPLLIVTYSVATANERSEVPEFVSNLSVYPNPVVGPAKVAFEVTKPSLLRIDVVDVMGRRIASPVDHVVAAGRQTLPLATQDLTPGLYLVRLQSEGYSTSRTVVVQ